MTLIAVTRVLICVLALVVLPDRVEPGRATPLSGHLGAPRARQHLREDPRRHQRRGAGDVHQEQARQPSGAALPPWRHPGLFPHRALPHGPRRALHHGVVGPARIGALVSRRHVAGQRQRGAAGVGHRGGDAVRSRASTRSTTRRTARSSRSPGRPAESSARTCSPARRVSRIRSERYWLITTSASSPPSSV